LSVAVVTDSTSDIEPERARAIGIDVVPLFVRFGEQSFRDYIDLSRAEFYRKLQSEPDLPNTSQPTAAMFADAFRPHVERGEEVLCITISSKLSGTINAATAAAGSFPGAPIAVFDSQTVAGGLGMQVERARELARGGASLDEILRELERERQTQRLYACIADLSHAVRTGRIGKAKAALGTLMNIVPVISLREGEVVAEAQVRTMRRAQETMLDLAIAAAGERPSAARFLVMHTNARALASGIAARLRERIDGREPQMPGILEAGPVIATHGGSGAVGIFVAAP
jgi:DegV family protein with EDD domain